MNVRQQLLDEAIVESLLKGTHSNPFSVLGAHRLPDSEDAVLRVFLPGAEAIDVTDREAADDKLICSLTRIHKSGLFEGLLPARLQRRYRLRVHFPLATRELDDPYSFGSCISGDDLYLFHEGRHERAYQFLGANHRCIDGVTGVLFAVWAPNARRVAVVGDFNNWDERVHGMRLHFDSGIWELFLPGVEQGEHYKFAIQSADGTVLPLRADPYARSMEVRPGTASRVGTTAAWSWQDQQWMQSRGRHQHTDAAISIYEVHLGSWRRNGDGGFIGYRGLADELIPYVKDMGFTHIQLMPVNEHPFDASWGYQPIGMFAPTSRFGTADEFRYLVDLAHRNNIGVLLDWVPGHFPTDIHGLGNFDGTHLYEHSDPRQGFHPDWKTLIFNYERAEVVSYLLSNALFWLEEFHIDGLRFDAVASMLYLDYSREDGQWLPNRHGGRENLAAIELLRLVNTRAYARFPNIMMVAEESTAWPGVTQFAASGGLGFGFKWNMGWMNDTLSYISRDPIHRQFHHSEMTFGLLYAFSENFILPLSHDEVVHGKRSLVQKMPGDDWQKFANLRAYLGFMWGHPGKKLLFMGGEFAQRTEWRHDFSLDWHLLQYPGHEGMQRLVKDLNRFYVAQQALWSQDHNPEGFEWIAAGEHTGAIFVFIRRAREPAGPAREIIVASNLTPTLYEGYRIGVPGPGSYREALNTNKDSYGGSGHGNPVPLPAEAVPSHGRDWSISLTLPPLGTIYLVREVTDR